MFRRSRFSVRPNVGTTGRTAAATPQEAPSANQEASETPRDAVESSSATAVTNSKSDVSEKATAPGDGNDPNGEGTSSSAAVQRRKRFSIKPKVAPGRPSTLSRTPKSPVKAVSEAPVESSGSNHDKPTSNQTGTSAAPQGFQSQRRRRPSEESKQLKIQPKATSVSCGSLGTSDDPAGEDPQEQTPVQANSSKQLENISTSQVKEVPPRPPDKVPPSLPDKEATEISEKAKTLVSSKNVLSLTQSAYSLSRLLNGPSDLQRLVKAQKLRELLRQERRKEKKLKKAKALPKEFSLDPAKMTMRDLIRYLPTSNPMPSSIEDSTQENETVIPPSPRREESPEPVQEPEVCPNTVNSRQEDEEEADEDQEEALMVPQVKVAEDGSLIIDEESLTVEVQRAKGPNPAENRDPIFERGSTTTYSSFRKGTYSKPWSSEETDMFFLAVSMVGTDFSMICQLFPHRARSEIKNKFKKEERENSWRIDKAFRERRKLDIEYFSKLLEKILEFQKSRKKLKSLAEKNSPKKRSRKTKAKKSARKLSDVEEGDEEEDENQVPDLEAEEEGEKENEDLCNEGGTPASEPKRKCKRKKRSDALTEEPHDKKNKTGEAGIPEDAEAALPEDHTSSDMSEKSQNANTANNNAIKPAKLSRGRAPKPLLPLGRKWGKKLPPSTTAKDNAADKEDESVSDGATIEQVNKDASPSNQANNKKSAGDDISSEEEDNVTVKLPQPTRYGRVPKPTKPLTYPAKEEAHSSASETTPASPVGSSASAAKPKPKCAAKRRRSSKPEPAQKSKRPKLVTLRASQSDFSDEDEEVEQLACSSSRDDHAPIFVPASLNISQHGISEVDETMVELDILASMPDVLGISQDALCPDSSCEQAQHEAGTAESCEHQLDLLVDVIDLLSSEHTEVTEDESYNEAAQTLLTIGNLAHISQSAPNSTAIQDHTAGTTTAGVNETNHPEGEAALKQAAQEESATPSVSAAFSQEVTQTSATVELQGSITESGEMPVIKTSDQMCGEQNTVCEMDPAPQSKSSSTSSPQTKRGRLPKVKPKPNLGRTSRTSQLKSQPETSTVTSAEESPSAALSLSQTNEMLSAAEETAPKTSGCAPGLSKEGISSTEVKLTEEPSDSQEKFVEQVESGAAMSDQNSSEIQAPYFSETQCEPSRDQTTRDTKSTSESTDKKLKSCVEEAEAGFNTPATSESVITEVEKRSHTDSAPVQESSDEPPSCVSPAEDLSEKQKEESVVRTACQSRRGRLQKVKPKPNLPQTSRTAKSKLQTAKEPADKDSSLTPNPDFHKSTIEVEQQPTCNPSHGIQSHPDPASLNLDSTLTPTEELSTHEEKNVGLDHAGTATSDQSASEIQEAQFESRKEQVTREVWSTSRFTDENVTNTVETSESSSNNVTTTDSTVTESQVEQGSHVDSASVQESSVQPAIEELPVSKDGGDVASTCKLRRSRLQKPKPNLPQTSRTMHSKPEPRKDPVTLTKIVEKPHSPTSMPDPAKNTTAEVEAQPSCSTIPPEKSSQIKRTGSPSVPVQSLELSSTHKCTQELSSTEDEKIDVGLVSSAEDSEKNVPQRRRRFPKVKPKPNLGSSTRITKLQSDDINKLSKHCQKDTTSNITSEQQPGDNNNARPDQNLTEKDTKHLTSAHCLSSEGLISTEVRPADCDKLLDSTNSNATSSDGMAMATSCVAESQSVLTDSVPENTSSEQSTVEMESTLDKLSSNDPVVADPTSQDDDTESELTDASKTSRKVQQVRRGRLIKPKPNLARSSRLSQPRKVQNTKPAETDSGSCSQSATSSVDHKPASELRPDMQEPVKGVTDEFGNQTSTPSDVGSSVGCWSQVITQQSEHNSPSNDSQASMDCVPSTQIASTPSTEGNQSYPVFPGMLPEQVPSDPDEPFFILSLTEIPVSSSGEVINSAAEHLSYLPVTDASVQQPSSVCGESLAAAGDGSLASAPVPMSAGESGVIGPEPAALIRSTIGSPVDPHETTTVQPGECPDTADNTEIDVAPAKQTPVGARRRAKPQVKSSNTRKKQTNNTLEAESVPTQANTTQDSEHPGDSVQPKAFDDTEPHEGGGGDVDTDKETLTGGKDPQSSSGVQSTQSIGTSSRKRKSKDFPPFPSETNNTAPSVNPPPGKAADKQSSSEPVASTSHDVAPTQGLTQQQKEAQSTSITPPTQTEVDIQQTSDHSPSSSDPTPSTSQSTAEASASHQRDCMESSSLEEEEPTSVSQYFLSDIFTEVQEE